MLVVAAIVLDATFFRKPAKQSTQAAESSPLSMSGYRSPDFW